MQRNDLFIKNICTLLAVLCVFHLFSPIIKVQANEGSVYSTIGGIEITMKKESEIESLLADAIGKWKSEPIIVRGESGRVEILAQMIQFDVKESVAIYAKAIKKPWYKLWEKTPIVHLPLQVELSDEINEKLLEIPFFKVEETKEAILEHASHLLAVEVSPKEIAISKDLMERSAFEIQEIRGSRASLLNFIGLLDGMMIAPNDIFSFLEKMTEMTGADDFETRRFFASVLYSVILQSDTKIIERHSQNKVPDYLRPGIEVDISPRLNEDLKFQNTSDSPMLFHASIEDDHLLLELYTIKGTKNVTYSVKETEIKSRTIYRLSAEVKSGREKLLQTGTSGYRVTVYRSIYDESSGLLIDEEISNDFYPPVHKVIAVSSEIEKQESPSTENNGQSNQESNNQNANDSKNNDNQTGDANQNDSNKPGSIEDDEQEEIIYDKGGNVIYDPNV